MGFLSRIEPRGPELVEINDECIPLLWKARWLKFMFSFHGHNIKVSIAFTHNFNGQVARVWDIEMPVDEDIIAEATHFPLEGEFWSKITQVKDIPWSKFLISPKMTYNMKGMHITQIKKKWCPLCVIIKCYIVCERCYNLILYYNFRLLMVFLGCKLILSHFLSKSSFKMAKAYQGDN